MKLWKFGIALSLTAITSVWGEVPPRPFATAPRIVNIINFVRQCEPREPERLSPQVLYETTLSQV